MSDKIPDQRGSSLKCSLNRVISCRICALKAWSLLTCLYDKSTVLFYHFLICHLHRSSMIRLSHKLPINSQKVADKSVSKLLKSCHFIFKVAQKFIFFTCLHLKLVLLLSLPPGFVWIFLSLAILAFSGVARFAPSLLASAIGLIGSSSASSSQLESESMTVLAAILKNVSCVTAGLMDRRATPSWHW